MQTVMLSETQSQWYSLFPLLCRLKPLSLKPIGGLNGNSLMSHNAATVCAPCLSKVTTQRGKLKPIKRTNSHPQNDLRMATTQKQSRALAFRLHTILK